MSDAEQSRQIAGFGPAAQGRAEIAPPSAPIVFLDIDGVLATRKAAGWSRQGKPLLPGSLRRRPAHALDDRAIARLNALCEKTGAVVVVSSMWRLKRDVPAMLKNAGCTATFHEGWATDADGPTRADEISRWLAAHDHGLYVVIDDQLASVAAMKDRLVLVDRYHGLEPEGVERAIRLLQEAP